MGGVLCDVTPQVLDRIVIRRVAGQLKDGHPVGVHDKELTGGLGCVVPCAILDEQEGGGGLFQHLDEKSAVTLGVELAGEACVEELTAEELDEAEHLVGPAFAGGLNNRLLTAPCPGV